MPSGGARNLIGFLDAFKAANSLILTFTCRYGESSVEAIFPFGRIGTRL
jgi:hypothetical protein